MFVANLLGTRFRVQRFVCVGVRVCDLGITPSLAVTYVPYMYTIVSFRRLGTSHAAFPLASLDFVVIASQHCGTTPFV